MNDMADSQLTNGLVPDIAPNSLSSRMLPRFAGMGQRFLLVPWQQYQFDGDLDLLRRHYDGMKCYVDYLASRATNHIVNYGLGDWYDVGPRSPGIAQLTPISLTATAFYYYDTWILAQAAALLAYRTRRTI